MKGLFITSNNTNSGKTFIATRIIQALKIDIYPYKPIETACTMVNGELYPHDAHALNNACRIKRDINQVCPYQFSLEASAELASRDVDISLDDLINQIPNGFALVEGAGGFFSPLLTSTLNADLAKALGLPIVIVVDNILGAISEALLTIRAVQSYDLDIFAVVMNTKYPNELNNCQELSKYTDEVIIEYNNDEQFIEALQRVCKV